MIVIRVEGPSLEEVNGIANQIASIYDNPVIFNRIIVHEDVPLGIGVKHLKELDPSLVIITSKTET